MKTPLSLRSIIAVSTVFASVAFLEVKADVLAYDPFNYSAGNLAGNGGGFGWTGNWTASGGGTATVTTPGSTYTDLTTLGNKATITPVSGSMTAVRTFDTTYTTGTVYISFLAQNTNEGERFFGLSLFNGATEQLLIGKNGNTLPAFQNWGLGAGATLSNSTVSSYNLSLLVARIDFNDVGNETIRLYINPTSNIEPVSADASITTVNLTGFDRIRLAAGFAGSGQTTITGTIDEVRLGQSFSDVSPIPEPAVASLVSMGLISFLVSGRRRRHLSA